MQKLKNNNGMPLTETLVSTIPSLTSMLSYQPRHLGLWSQSPLFTWKELLCPAGSSGLSSGSLAPWLSDGLIRLIFDCQDSQDSRLVGLLADLVSRYPFLLSVVLSNGASQLYFCLCFYSSCVNCPTPSHYLKLPLSHGLFCLYLVHGPPSLAYYFVLCFSLLLSIPSHENLYHACFLYSCIPRVCNTFKEESYFCLSLRCLFKLTNK